MLVRRSECDVKLDSCLRWKEYKEIFESLRGYCHENLKSIPLMFVLGFYVSIVVTRYQQVLIIIYKAERVFFFSKGAFVFRKDPIIFFNPV